MVFFVPRNLPILSFFIVVVFVGFWPFRLFCLPLVFTSKISYEADFKELYTRVYFIGARPTFMRFKSIRNSLILKTINLLNEIFYI